MWERDKEKGDLSPLAVEEEEVEEEQEPEEWGMSEEDDSIDYSDHDVREDYLDNFPIDRKEDWD